jgi:Mn2+/Fe2+ NRAMP family transporter
MRAMALYTSMRLLLFVVCFGLIYLAGARAFLLLALALVSSGIVSYVVLSRQRDAMSGALVSTLRGFRERLNAGTSSEDQD